MTLRSVCAVGSQRESKEHHGRTAVAVPGRVTSARDHPKDADPELWRQQHPHADCSAGECGVFVTCLYETAAPGFIIFYFSFFLKCPVEIVKKMSK